MNWDEIKREYETSDITLKALADKHDIKLGTLKSRKSREGWERDATQVKVASPKKRKEQKKRSGNPNPKNQFTERNSAAMKHGLFSRYMPKETLEIMGMIEDRNPVDLLWDQIQIQYAAIIRSQKIMWVEDKDDLAKEQSQFGFGDSGADKYEIQFAWDRQATFLTAQSRAISELRTSIKQFNDMAHEDDARKLKLEQMQVGIEKTKAEIVKIEKGNSPDNKTEDKLKEYFTALGGAFRD
ncbi:phage terminase small subunit [Terribacillus sp. 179-K 1B1 HS]|uniref:phage terminase small subunit n=1 Tax=Terribacillus sp. 179-K 1B1 HS TaxID=3142388 RepID=UPI00399F48AD